MPATRKPQRAVVLDEPQLIDPELAIYPDDQLATDDAPDASLCPTCGEPLTWHEEACALPSTTPAAEPTVAANEVQPTTVGTYAYPVGGLVQPTTQVQAHPIVWRGQLKERHPATGLVQRVNVYRLNDGYWDCYREEELQAA